MAKSKMTRLYQFASALDQLASSYHVKKSDVKIQANRTGKRGRYDFISCGFIFEDNDSDGSKQTAKTEEKTVSSEADKNEISADADQKEEVKS